MKERYCRLCDTLLVLHYPDVRDPLTGQTFTVLACPECGFRQTFPQPFNMTAYYGELYYGKRHGFTASHCLRRRMRLVRRMAGPGRRRRLLDVGCGSGDFMLTAAAEGWTAFGIELESAPARELGLSVFTTAAEAADAGPFDCVTLWHTLEHFADPVEILMDLRRLILPGGIVLIAVPNVEGMQASLFGAKWFHLDVPRHLSHFGPRSLTLALRSAGIEPIGCWHHELEYDVFGWTQSALNSLLPTPNVFFSALTGKAQKSNLRQLFLSAILGSLFTVAALPLTFASSKLGRGATLVMAGVLGASTRPSER